MHDDPLVTVATYATPMEAEVARSVLDSHGIQALVRDTHSMAMMPHLESVLGGVRLEVAGTLADEAREHLNTLEGTQDRSGEPVFQVLRHRGWVGTMVGAFVGWSLVPSLGIVVFAVLGLAIGRKMTVRFCSNCMRKVDKNEAVCPQCQGSFHGIIAHRNQRLAAEEANDTNEIGHIGLAAEPGRVSPPNPVLEDNIDPQDLFFELFESLPRQGPGNYATTKRALDACEGLPFNPTILDLGCGTGAQTLHLAQLTNGHITAVDSHPPHIVRLTNTVEQQSLAQRIKAQVGDMNALPFEPASFDLVWSEGALYNLGLPRALPICRRLLRPQGLLVFSDAVWHSESPPAQVQALFADYPGMGTVDDMLSLLTAEGWQVLSHFEVPPEAWWQDFYTPMEQQIEVMRKRWPVDAQVQTVLSELAAEAEMHRQHGSHYGYEMFVAQRT